MLHMDAEGERSPQTARPVKPAKPPDRLRRSPACSRAKASRDVPAARKRRLTTSGMSAGVSEVATTQKKNWKRGSGADDSRRAATPVAICAGLRAMLVTSGARETAQPAEAAETVVPSQTGRGIPAAREEMLSTSGIAAGASEDGATQKGSRRLQGREPRYSRDADSGTEGRRQELRTGLSHRVRSLGHAPRNGLTSHQVAHEHLQRDPGIRGPAGSRDHHGLLLQGGPRERIPTDGPAMDDLSSSRGQAENSRQLLADVSVSRWGESRTLLTRSSRPTASSCEEPAQRFGSCT